MTQQGYWPDPPSRRMAWDADGTICMFVHNLLASNVELTQAQKQIVNDEGGKVTNYVYSPYDHTKFTFIFPEKRNVTHYYAAWSRTYGGGGGVDGNAVSWSNDTTNGMDGTWTTVASSWQTNSIGRHTIAGGPTSEGLPDSRTHLETFPVDGVKALRFQVDSSPEHVNEEVVYTFHLYGHKAAGETPHRLDFAFADGSELVQDHDYGDQPRGSIRTWSTVDTWNIGSGLFIRNRSPEKVADSVTITMQNLSSDMINRLTLSKDNVSYGSQITYTAIQPLQIVGPVYLKHNVPDTTTLGLYTARLKITVGDWI